MKFNRAVIVINLFDWVLIKISLVNLVGEEEEMIRSLSVPYGGDDDV